MKKSLLFLLAFFVTFLSFSQFTLNINGAEATDGDVFTFNTTGATADMLFVLTNTNESDDINVSVIVEEIINNSAGDNVQFCWGVCYESIAVGTQLPPAPETLAPGASTHPDLNHFINNYTGDDTEAPVSYTFKFREVDDGGNEMGTPITITYVYDSTYTSVADINQVSFELYPTIVTDYFTLEIEEEVNIAILNMNGKIVKEFTVDAGKHAVDVSILANQLYYVILTNKQGQKSLTKTLILITTI